MSYFIQRALSRYFIFLLVAMWWVNDAYAGVDFDGSQGSALAHCLATGDTFVAAKAEYYGLTHQICQPGFPHLCFSGSCTDGGIVYVASEGQSYPTYLCKADDGSQCDWGSEIVAYHAYDPNIEDCESGNVDTHYASGVLPASFGSVAVCNDGCEYVDAGQPITNCTYTDANGNGVSDDGESYNCAVTVESTGNTCAGGNTMNQTPEPNQHDCTNVQCGADQGSSGGTGTDDPGGDLPDDNPSNNPPGPGGDGDPDTPSGPGTGDGDTDGDGDRDVDCNPQSNPDCSYTGDGQGSGNCDVQPSCNGDPVQCAILYQEWASMCYDGTSLNNPTDCRAELQCEGDKLQCEIIRQQRDQYCALYVGDGSTDLDVFNDSDFTRDLKDEAEEIDLPTAVDTAGFGSGACPAPFQFSAFGSGFEISVQPFCDFAPLVRALVILAALISAAFIVTGTRH